MKKLFISIALFTAIVSMSNPSFSQPVTAKDQNLKLGRGVNIIGYDKVLWQDHTKGRFKESYFKMIKDAGFSSVRINLHPFSHMNDQYQIDPAWLETLDWAVQKTLEADLMLILDMHEYNAMADDPE